MGETTLSGMKAIQEHCRAMSLPASEVTVLKMIREAGFPARKLGGIWMSDVEYVAKWVKSYISSEITEVPPQKKLKRADRAQKGR